MKTPAIAVLFLTSCCVLGCAAASRAPQLPDPVSGSASGAVEPGAAEPGAYRDTFRPTGHDRKRSYRLVIPAGYEPANPAPLVVVVHGAFNHGAGMEKKTGFSQLAEREGFVVAYPEGIGLQGLFQHWNAGFCCGKALRLEIDDVGFLDQVIERISRRLAIDAGRVSMIGESNGAMLIYSYAARYPERLAAAGISAGAHGGRPAGGDELWVAPPPPSPLPLIAFHGLADERVPFAGYEDQSTLPVGEALAGWAEANGCSPQPVVERRRGDKLVYQRFAGPGCAPVELYALEGWGHEWPGRRFTDELPSDDPLRGFDAAELAWSFFERWRRAESGDLIELKPAAEAPER